MPGLLRGDEGEPYRWCLAKKAAASFKISSSSSWNPILASESRQLLALGRR
jgi:hypothetical protein